MSTQPPLGQDERPSQARTGEQPQNIAAAIADVSERATLLVREEIELAKAEMTERVQRLARGTIVGVVAGVFFLTALLFILIGGAWLLYFYLPVNNWAYFWGFFAMAAILVVLGAIAGLIARQAIKRGSPPAPTMAIDEARKIRETVETAGVPAPAPAAPQPPAGDMPPTGAQG